MNLHDKEPSATARPSFIPDRWKDRDGTAYPFRAAWQYCDRDNKPIGYVARFDNETGKQVIPFFKPNGRGFKSGGPTGPVLFGRERLNGSPALIVEGEKCAAALHSLGLAAVTSQGGALKAADGDWAALAGVPGVYVLPDNDGPGEQYARAACKALAQLDPVPDVRVARLPVAEKGDVVDWLQQRAPEWDGFDPIPLEHAQALRDELLEALRDSERPPADWLTEDEAPAPQPTPAASRYLATPSGMKAIRVGKGGDIEETTLANFTARIIEETARDDGAEITLQLVVAGEQGGRPLPRAAITFEAFQAMTWPAKHWGSHCIIEPGNNKRDTLRTAIQTLSHAAGVVERRTVFVHTGWRRMDGAWLYLHGAGAIGAAGPVKGIDVDLGDLARYALPALSRGPDERREAAAASLAMLDLAPPSVTVPLLAGVFLAPLAQALNVDFMLWLEGPSQSQKSSLAAVALAHFGAAIDRTCLTASWLDSANALEGKLFNLADALAVVDDYAPQPSAQAQHTLDATASRVIRSCGNRQGRGRLRADLSQRPERYPRGLTVATAEQWPVGESVNARLFGVTLKRGEVNLPALSRAQVNASGGLLARCMADYLQDLAARFDEVVQQAKQDWQAYRAAALQQRLSGRAPEQVAFLLVGAQLALRHFKQAGLTLPDLDIIDILMSLARRHAAHVLESQPADRFRQALRELLDSGAAYLERVDSNGDAGTSAFPDSSRRIGWRCEVKRELYLLATPILEMVNEALRKGDTGLNIRPRALWRQCQQRGWLQAGNATEVGTTETTRTVWIQGKAVRVLVFNESALES